MPTGLEMLYAVAAADALGAATEFCTPDQIQRRHGRVEGYVGGSPFGFAPGECTDDTQMLLCILAAYRRPEPSLAEAALARCQEWLQAGPPDAGGLVRSSLAAARSHGLNGGYEAWRRTGFHSAGNGGLMRAAASFIAGSRGKQLLRETVVLTALTHADPRSLLACLAYSHALEALAAGAPYAAAWQAASACAAAYPLAQVIGQAFGPAFAADVAPRAAGAAAAVAAAIAAGLQGEAGSQSGFVLDTLQAAVAHGAAPSYMEGVLAAVNLGNDADTAAAVAGGVLAARGLLPPPHLLEPLREGAQWPLWPDRKAPAVGRFIRFAPEAEEAAARGVPEFEFSQVERGVLAGRNPLFPADVERLAAAGVTHVLDLREPAEWEGSDRYGRAAVRAIAARGWDRLHRPVRDQGPPTLADLDAAVAYIEGALAAGGTVYVHCRAGWERTGAVLTAWYARARGLDYAGALAKLQERRPTLRPLPRQEQAVRRWLAQPSRQE